MLKFIAKYSHLVRPIIEAVTHILNAHEASKLPTVAAVPSIAKAPADADSPAA